MPAVLLLLRESGALGAGRPQLASVCRRHRERTACMDRRRSLCVADLQKLSNCPLMTAAAVDSAGAKLSTHDHERLHTGSAGAHPSRKFSSRAPRAAEAVDSPAPAVDSRASCPPTPPYLSTHPNEHLDTCSAGRQRARAPSGSPQQEHPALLPPRYRQVRGLREILARISGV